MTTIWAVVFEEECIMRIFAEEAPAKEYFAKCTGEWPKCYKYDVDADWYDIGTLESHEGLRKHLKSGGEPIDMKRGV